MAGAIAVLLICAAGVPVLEVEFALSDPATPIATLPVRVQVPFLPMTAPVMVMTPFASTEALPLTAPVPVHTTARLLTVIWLADTAALLVSVPVILLVNDVIVAALVFEALVMVRVKVVAWPTRTLPPVDDAKDCETVIGAVTDLVRGLLLYVTAKDEATALDIDVPGDTLVMVLVKVPSSAIETETVITQLPLTLATAPVIEMTLPVTLTVPAVPPVQVTLGTPLIVTAPGPPSVAVKLSIFSVLAAEALLTVMVSVVLSPAYSVPPEKLCETLAGELMAKVSLEVGTTTVPAAVVDIAVAGDVPDEELVTVPVPLMDVATVIVHVLLPAPATAPVRVKVPPLAVTVPGVPPTQAVVGVPRVIVPPVTVSVKLVIVSAFALERLVMVMVKVEGSLV